MFQIALIFFLLALFSGIFAFQIEVDFSQTARIGFWIFFVLFLLTFVTSLIEGHSKK